MNIYQILEALKDIEETCDTGTTFVGKMKGTDPASARYSKLVGECDAPVTLADRLRARWEQTKAQKGLQEYGMTTGGTVAPQSAGASSSTSTADAEKVNQAQQNLNKLKSVGVDLPTSVGQAAKSAVSTVNNPDSATGQGLNGDSQKLLGTLGKEVEDLIANGTSSQVQALATALAANK
jgi:hypothetical protein